MGPFRWVACGLVLISPLLSVPQNPRAQNGSVKPLASVPLERVAAQPAAPSVFAQISFLTSKSIAVGICFGQSCNLTIFALADGKLSKAAETDHFVPYTELFRSVDGRVLEDHV